MPIIADDIILSIASLLEKKGGETYLVGGSVRDFLLGLPVKDYDLLVRNLTYDAVAEHLQAIGWPNKVGRSFGVVKFKPRTRPDLEIDLALPRKESSTGTGHRDFAVDYDPAMKIEDDLGRRDFTFNAMALHIASGDIVDPFGGQADLKNKVLRQVFPQAFIEDPLRLLRAVQFAARFRLAIEPVTRAAMKEHAPLIKTVSPERVMAEMKKLFLAEKPSLGFNIIREAGILPILFPFIHSMIGVLQPKKLGEDVYQHTMKVLDASRTAFEMQKPGDPDIMMAALLHDTGKPRTYRRDPQTGETTFFGHQIVSKRIANKWLNQYRAASAGFRCEHILKLVEGHMFETKAYFSERAIRRFVNKIGKDAIFDLIDLRIADKKGGRYPDSMKGIINLRSRIQQEIDKKVPFGAKDLAINGHDIMGWGYSEGPAIGRIQKFLVEAVLDDPPLNTPEALKEIVLKNFELPASSPRL